MSALRTRLGVGPRPLAAGSAAALVVLFGVVLLWTRRPSLAFLVSFGGQFVAWAGVYFFVQYRTYGDDFGQQARAVGHSGGLAGVLISRGDTEAERDERRHVAGGVLAFLVTAAVGFVVLSFTGGDVAALVPV